VNFSHLSHFSHSVLEATNIQEESPRISPEKSEQNALFRFLLFNLKNKRKMLDIVKTGKPENHSIQPYQYHKNILENLFKNYEKQEHTK